MKKMYFLIFFIFKYGFSQEITYLRQYLLGNDILVSKANLKLTNILPIFPTKFVFFTTTIIWRVVLNFFQGEILLVVRIVPCQTSYLKMLTMILMIRQMLILLGHKHVFGKQEEWNKARPLEWSANSSLNKYVERVSKD